MNANAPTSNISKSNVIVIVINSNSKNNNLTSDFMFKTHDT